MGKGTGFLIISYWKVNLFWIFIDYTVDITYVENPVDNV